MDLRELHLTKPGAGRHPWEETRAKAVEFLLRRSLGEHATGTSILDFGCGDAFLVSRLAEQFASGQVVAVDRAFDAEAREHLASRLYPRLRLFDSLSSVESENIPPASVVLLLDVLEHCELDSAPLKALVESPAVAPGALFLITVPAFQSLFCNHDTFLGHYRRYRVAQLSDVVKASGLKVLEQSYFFSSLLLPRGAQVALEKLGWKSLSPKGLGDYRAKPVFDSVVKNILWADFRFCELLARQGIRLPGLSCFVLARKG